MAGLPQRTFWSLTLYNDQHLFNPNPLKSYSLGTKTRRCSDELTGNFGSALENTSIGDYRWIVLFAENAECHFWSFAAPFRHSAMSCLSP